MKLDIRKTVLGVLMIGFATHSLRAQDPDWTVDYSQFQFRMSVSALIEREGEWLEQGENKVAAFVDGEIRGLGYANVYHEPTDRYLVVFQIGSHVSSGEEVTIYIYDENQNATFEARDKVTFEADALLGTITDPYIISDNRYPTMVSLSTETYDENLTSGETIAMITVDDADDEEHTFELSEFAPINAQNLISIEGSNVVVDEVVSFEQVESFTFTLRATDELGASISDTFTIQITDQAEAPSDIILSNDELVENNSVSQIIGVLSTTDDDLNETHSYSFINTSSNTDTVHFEIQGDTLFASSEFDFEEGNSYELSIRSEDKDGLSIEEIFTIQIIDENEAPKISERLFEVQENVPIGYSLGFVEFSDEDTDQVVELTLSGENLPFALNSSTGELTVNSHISYESVNLFEFEVTATDNGTPEMFVNQQYTLEVINEDEPPTNLSLSHDELIENNTIPQWIGKLTSDDDDQEEVQIYSFSKTTSNEDTIYFKIQGDSLLAWSEFDYEQSSSYQLSIQVEDKDGLTMEISVTIQIIDENEAPKISERLFEVQENVPIGYSLGFVEFSDEDTDQVVELTLSGENLPFALNSSTGELTVNSHISYESVNLFEFEVTATDDGTPEMSSSRALTLTVSDLSEAPTDITLSDTFIPENLEQGTLVGFLTVEDEDNSERFDFEILPNEDGVDHTYFELIGNELITIKDIDKESNSSYALDIRVTDKDNLSFERTLFVFVIDQNESPVVKDAYWIIEENESIGTLIGEVEAFDPDEGQMLSFSLNSSIADLPFEINPNSGQINVTSMMDYESRVDYYLSVAVIDDGIPAIEEVVSLHIQVTDINEVPIGVLITNQTVAENGMTGIIVGTLETLDPDEVDFFNYEIVSINSELNANEFVVLDNKLFTNQSFDHEEISSYAIEIRTLDKEGLFTSEIFDITIEDVNEIPWVSDTTFLIPENSEAGTVVGLLEIHDDDMNQSYTYEILDQDIPTFVIDQSGQIIVDLSEPMDYEANNSFSFQVLVTDDGFPIEKDTSLVTVQLQDIAERDLPIRNYLSPNGDGVNDFLTIENHEIYSDFVLTILSSRGHTLFRQVNYDNTWGGRYRGQILPTGVYYYIFENQEQSARYEGKFYIKER